MGLKDRHLLIESNSLEYLIILDEFKTFDDLYFRTDEVLYTKSIILNLDHKLLFLYVILNVRNSLEKQFHKYSYISNNGDHSGAVAHAPPSGPSRRRPPQIDG